MEFFLKQNKKFVFMCVSPFIFGGGRDSTLHILCIVYTN